MKRRSNVSARTSGRQAPPAHDHEKEIAAARRRLPSDANIGRLAELFDAISVSTRLRIMLALRSDNDDAAELCVSDLAELIEASESLTSHQLRELRSAGLVTQRREGKLVLYRLATRSVDDLLGQALEYVG